MHENFMGYMCLFGGMIKHITCLYYFGSPDIYWLEVTMCSWQVKSGITAVHREAGKMCSPKLHCHLYSYYNQKSVEIFSKISKSRYL